MSGKVELMTQQELMLDMRGDVSRIVGKVDGLDRRMESLERDVTDLNRRLFVGNGKVALMTRLHTAEIMARDASEHIRDCPARSAVNELMAAERSRSGREGAESAWRMSKGAIWYRAMVDVPKLLLVALLSTLVTLVVVSLLSTDDDDAGSDAIQEISL